MDSMKDRSTRVCLHPAAERQRGVALILVIMVLTALVVIGTPFAISMKLQEEGSRQITARERARLAQISARNHAVAHLFASHPSREDGTVEIDRSISGSGSNRASDYLIMETEAGPAVAGVVVATLPGSTTLARSLAIRIPPELLALIE
ncbi:MAG: hypothetical protein AAF488_11355 [Planctomycetota bacterium]